MSSAGISLQTHRLSFCGCFLAEHSRGTRPRGYPSRDMPVLAEMRSAMKPNLATLVAAALASTLVPSASAQELGRVHFETSCTPQAQEKFNRGLALVHSFFYPDSVQAFTEAAAADA